MYLKASFDGKVSGLAMEIPRRAIFNSDMVFVVKDSSLMKARINIVKINQQTIIFNGLEEGLKVVTEPLVNMVEGTKVETY